MFILSLEELLRKQTQLKTQQWKLPIPYPVTSYKQLRCRVQNSHLNTLSMPSTSDETFFTKQATERMLKIFPTKETLPSITDSNLFSPTYQTQETSSESSDEESQQTQALLQQLQQQRNKQRKFRLRIQQLIQQLNM